MNIRMYPLDRYDEEWLATLKPITRAKFRRRRALIEAAEFARSGRDFDIEVLGFVGRVFRDGCRGSDFRVEVLGRNEDERDVYECELRHALAECKLMMERMLMRRFGRWPEGYYVG